MNQRIMPILVALAGIVVSIFIMLQVIFNPTGGLAGILKYAAVPLIAICFLTPKTGLIILCWVSFYADYYKKLAVYYGTSSMMTVMEVLALSMAMVGAIIGGSVSQALIRGPVPDKTSRNLFLITMVITGLFLASGGDGMSGKVQNAVNSGLYLGLAAVICYHLQDRESALKLCRLQFWLGVPWVVWAARQYFYGFTEMEWFYARKGFSPVLAGQMLGMEIPRPYGFGGSSSAYGVITYLFMFGVWHAMRFEKMRPLYWAGALVFAGGLFVSMQRTILILPILTFGAYLLFRTPGGVKLFYTSVLVVLVSGILASDLLLGGLGEANEKIRVEGTGWASKVVQVGTFADRLKGWTRLKKAKSYSLFGTGSGEITSFDSDDYSHDVINRILIHYGLVGLGVTFGLLIWTARRVHGMVFKIRDPVDRDTLVFVVAVVGVNGIGTLMSGSNSGTVPINYVLATLIGLGAGVMRRNSEALAKAELLQDVAAPEPEQPGPLRPARAQFRMRPGRR